MKNLIESLPMDEIAQFCHRWKIQELGVFGSVLRADFDAESDIDIIVTFDDDADWSLLTMSECSKNSRRFLGEMLIC